MPSPVDITRVVVSPVSQIAAICRAVPVNKYCKLKVISPPDGTTSQVLADVVVGRVAVCEPVPIETYAGVYPTLTSLIVELESMVFVVELVAVTSILKVFDLALKGNIYSLA